MVTHVIIENAATKQRFTIPARLWAQKKNSKEFARTFKEVQRINEPPEVTELKARLSREKGNQ